MALGTDDGKTAGGFHLGRQLDIGTTTCHVGGDGHDTLAVNGLTGLGNDVGLLLVQLSVQHVVGDVAQVKHAAQHLTDLDARGTHQGGTS